MSQVPETVPEPGAVPANLGDYNFASTGLEDFAVTDAVLPRIKIEHQTGEWTDNLGGLKMKTLRFIALGLVKQRVLFHHNVENDDVPMCKASDHDTGYPNPDAPRDKSFPWQLSGFNPADFPPDAEGNTKLPCEGCALKDWGSSPIGDNPYCSEQWTLPIYYDSSPDFSGLWSPAILTLQKSSIKPIRTYFTSFAQAGNPPFITVGTATLKTLQRGQVLYSIPTFVKESESPRDRWAEFSKQFAEMRTYLMRPPVREIDGIQGQQQAVDNTWAGQAQAAQQMAQPPVQQQDPWATQQQQPTQGDPWAAQQQVQQPVQQVQQPVQQVQPPVQQQPVQQVQPPVQQQPVQQVQQPVQQVQQPVQQVQQPVQQVQPPVQQVQPPVQQQPVQQVQPPVQQPPIQQQPVQQVQPPVQQQPVQQVQPPAQQQPVEQVQPPVQQQPVQQVQPPAQQPVEQLPTQPEEGAPPAGQKLPF